MEAAPAHRDRLGLALGAASGEAARAYDEAVWEYVSFGRDPGARLKRALELDPAMPMAHCLQGYFMHLMGLPGLLPKARKALELASREEEISSREKAHISALGAWCDGELEQACRIFEDILREHPRDILALKLANYLYFYMGDAAGVRDSPSRVIPAWDAGMPGYGHVLALQAFGLEESGDYAAAERAGRRATELNPADPWAVHAVAHVMEMQDRVEDGIDWIRSLTAHWDAANFFRLHLWWHLALMHWSAGRPDEALRLYDAHIWAEGSSENLSLCNDMSMLARLQLAGVDVGARWEAAATVVRAQLTPGGSGSVLAFVDAHYAMALGEVPGLHAAGTTGRIHDKVGRALCQAAVAWRAGDHRRVASQLGPVRNEVWRVGGSHAQRDLFTLMLLDAAVRSGNAALAADLRAERARQRPAGRLPERLQ